MHDFNFQGFRFTGSNFRPAFGCFQFKYKGWEISASNMGVDKGACPTKVAVFSISDGKHIKDCDTVEEAVLFVNSIKAA